MDSAYTTKVESHWFSGSPGDLLARIDTGLATLGKSRDALVIDDLLAVDEFHIRGREATEELAELAGFAPGTSVVDVGSGLGGPSRYLASTRQCRVQGVDLTQEYCDVATTLAARVGLSERVTYQCGNALALPFPTDHFDAAWTQHISMNIDDKAGMFGEMKRVVKPGGKMAIYDPLAGPNAPITLPVPWATDPSMSHLLNLRETQSLLESLALQIDICRDVTSAAVAWFEKNAARAGEPPPLGLHLLLGEQWPTMAKNMVANLRSDRLNVVQIIVTVPD
ncbi:MAG: methyltransferase domain-containing protein [Pseudomonadota bacterium]